ncbi:MAG: VCBS repeat-containing protein [bacterium]|nr:VCBS repeat-containing protein [bacterium]
MTWNQDSGRCPRVLAAVALSASVALLSPSGAAAGECPSFVSNSEGLPTQIEWRTRPALADVNNDGLLDLGANPRKGARPYVWLSKQDGSWEMSSRGLATPDFDCGVGVDFADVNGDGHQDLGVADHCQGLFVFMGDGTGRWRMGRRPNPGGHQNYEDLTFGDINGDGHQDIVAVGALKGGMIALLGDGKGGWKRHLGELPRTGYGTNVILDDLNGDSALDIVAAFSPMARRGRKLHAVWLSKNAGESFESVETGLPDEGSYYGVATGDVNGDGHRDLALASNRRSDWFPLRVLRGDGTGKNWSHPAPGLPEPGTDVFYAVELVDINGDGLDDLIASRHHTSGIRLWLASKEGRWNECTDTGLPSDGGEEMRGWGLAVDDVNGDGLRDIVFARGRQSHGAIETWIQTGSVPAGAAGDSQ